MKTCTLDLETYWSQTHSLTKMSPILYCTHPETEIISCAFKFDKGPTKVIFGEQEVIDYCKTVDWTKLWVVGHNMGEFDAMICAWRMGIKPLLWGCTLAMARPIHDKGCGCSLKALCGFYGLGVKDNTALMNTKGRHLIDFLPQEIADMDVYNKEDVELTYKLLRRLIPQTKRAEVITIDTTIRMLVEPKFDLDYELMRDTQRAEKRNKRKIILDVAFALGCDMFAPMRDLVEEARSKLASAPKFKLALEAIGYEVPMKISPTTEKEIPALAKSDQAFKDMCEGEDSHLSTLALARMGVKSTILETRCENFMQAATCVGGKMPVALRYCGASNTSRWSAFAKLNQQNLPRINPYEPKPSDALRFSMRAPDGFKVVVADLSGVELRVNMFLWQVPYAMALFAADPENADLYRDFASTSLFNVPLTEVTKAQRQLGKVAHLALGFGTAGETFQKTAKTMGGVELNITEAVDTVKIYRGKHPEIKAGWDACGRALSHMQMDSLDVVDSPDPGGLITPIPGGWKTPTGMIRYPDLRTEQREDDWRTDHVYGHGYRKAKIYGAKAVENIVQHLARNIIADQCNTIRREHGLLPALMVHDELVYVEPEDESVEVLAKVQEIMRRPVEWFPNLKLWSEGDIAQTYGAAK